jgi:hypothetical protein
MYVGLVSPKSLAGFAHSFITAFRFYRPLSVSPSVHFGCNFVLFLRYTLLFDYTITSFLWIILLMSIAGVSSEKIGKSSFDSGTLPTDFLLRCVGILGSVYAIPWLFHLGYAFGLPLLFQLIYERGLIWGTLKW